METLSDVRVDSKTPNDEETQTPAEKFVEIDDKFTEQLKDPFDSVEWETRHASITNPQTGEKVFEANDLEFPKSWSQNCVALVAEKYFRYVEQEDGSKIRETSVRSMVSRVANTIANWGIQLDYFPHDAQANGSTRWPVVASARAFRNELAYILVNQMAAFNSPVWFNVGTKMGRHREEQVSACFLNSIEDNMQSILELSITEGKLYKGGSGSGVNYSALRSSREALSNGGYASGPVPFIAKDDFNAGAIKSGGGTRRAAKIAILNADHGDIFEFIHCKKNSEKAAHALIDGGFDSDFRARWGAYGLVPFQNANHSVRVTDAFMEAVERDGAWALMARDGETVIETVQARDLWEEICEAAHFCGDPGLQFDTTINEWHTSPEHGRIQTANPCAEFNYLDDTACNLASLNLVKFLRSDGSFDIEAYRHTVDVLITAMEIMVDAAGYPTPAIESNSSKFRPLGLGFTNLGGYLMSQALPYDSVEGRAQAAYLTAILTGRAYARSAELAHVKGPFEGYRDNATHMTRVMKKHRDAVAEVEGRDCSQKTQDLSSYAHEDWDRCTKLGVEHGYRNGQATVLAPAGTISFLMDADTTGIEPELSLSKVKKLVGGGVITILNTRVRHALKKLGYDEDTVSEIGKYVIKNGSLVGSLVKDLHLEIFDTSFPDPVGARSLRPESHILMMAAVQPFVSGAISKTCNIPNDATKDDISMLYTLAWQKNLKSVALYRDGSKRTQPLDTKKIKEIESQVAPEPLQLRRKLPNDCFAHRHKFNIGGHKGYIHVGLYPDGEPGEVFIKMAKEGSTVAGLMDTIGVLTSFCLQYGVPLDLLVDKLSYMNFEPQGITNHPDIRFAKSPVDYLFRYLDAEYVKRVDTSEVLGQEVVDLSANETKRDGLTCHRCGNPAQRAGSCVSCPTCGQTTGCS